MAVGPKDELVEISNWLLQTKAIDGDFEAIFWTSNDPLDILFEEIRDGVILVKLVLFLEENVESERRTSSRDYFIVTDGATFRRETNINLFLRKCVSIGAKRYFSMKDLERDMNRTGVLRTLKSFSKKLEKKMKKLDNVVKSFSVIPYIEEIDGREIDTEITYYMTKKRDQKYSNYIYKGRRSEETEKFIETYLTTMCEDARSELMMDGFLDKSILAHNKILQLRQKELGFQRKFLKTLEKIISSTTRNRNTANLYDIFKDLEEILTPLKRLHKKLFDKLLKNANPGPVFVEMKMDFWIYAPFIVLLINAATLIETFEKNLSVKQELEMIKSDMQKQIDAGDSSFPGTLDQLFYLPRQHLANYVVHLNAIIKSAKKELSKESGYAPTSSNSIHMIKIVQHCISAKSAMDDVLNYVNHAVGENANKSILRDLGHQLLGLTIFPEDFATNYGALVFEGKILHKWEKDSKYVNRYMVCMQKLIIICDIINKRGNRTVYSPNLKLELHLFDPRIRYSVMETNEPQPACMSQPLALTVVMTDNNLNPTGSPFNLKCRTSSSHQTLKRTLEQLFSASRVSSKFHPRHTHEYEIHESNGEFKEPPICGLEKCGNIISGLFIIGVLCKTCKKYYHNHCFITNSPDSPYEEDIDLVRNLSRLDSDDESDNEEDVDEIKNIFSDYDYFKKNINSFRVGSCILYFSDEENGVYKLAYKGSGPDDTPLILKMVISRNPSTNKIGGTNVLMENKEFDTLKDVIRYLRTNCSLKFLKKPRDYTVDKTNRNKENQNSSSFDYPEDIRPSLYHGDRKLALKGARAGTYLIYPTPNNRSNPFTIAVSRPDESTLGRIPIDVVKGDNGLQYVVKIFSNQRFFDSVSELIAYYKDKCNLLYPIVSEEDECSKSLHLASENYISSSQYYYVGSSTEDEWSSSDEDSDSSEGENLIDRKVLKDVEATEFYGGILDRFEAQKILLEIDVEGLYMLRVKPHSKELRLSLVRQTDRKEISSTFKKLRVVHIKVSLEEEEDDEGLKRHFYQMGQMRGYTFKDLIDVNQAKSPRKYEFKYPYSP